MTTYIVRRCLQAVIILLGLTVLLFVLLNAGPSGGQCAHYLITPTPNSQSLYDSCVKARGLDQPLPVQYVKWVTAAAHFDFERDYTGHPVIDSIKQKLPATILLIGVEYIFQQLIALPLGMLGALRRYSFYDQALTFVFYVGLSLPTFWLGLILILLFAVKIPLFPPGGIVGGTSSDAITAVIPPFGTSTYLPYLAAHPGPVLSDLLKHLALPALTLAVVGVAADSRFMRASMLDVINQDFVRTARAKGLPQRSVVLKHALRNALLPIITNFGLFIPALISGAIVTETIFGWPGMGQYFVQALGNKDNNTLLAVLLLTALFTLIGNLVADLLYAAADPRIRYS